MQDSDWTKHCPSYLVVVKDVCSPGVTRVPGIYGNHPPRGRITIAAQNICIKLGGKREEGGEKGRRSGGGGRENNEWGRGGEGKEKWGEEGGTMSGEEGEKKREYEYMEKVGNVQ